MPVTCAEMKRIEEAAFARGVQAEDLMEQAGLGLAEIVPAVSPATRHLRGILRRRATMAAMLSWPHRHLASWGWNA